MQDYPENVVDPGNGVRVLFYFFPVVLFVILLYEIFSSLETEAVWVPGRTISVPDLMRPTIMDGVTYYNEYEDVYVPGHYEKVWKWKK